MAAHRTRIWFHWLTVILVSAAYLIAHYREGIDDPDARLFWLDCHRSVGLALLALTVLRLVARTVLPFEPLHEPNALMKIVARITHILLYAGLVAMPLLGWAQSSAKAHKFKLFGMKFPSLVHHNADLGDLLGAWHEGIAWTLLALIGLHSAAALFHHFVLRDRVLLDMIRVNTAK